jgi:hypothetical protein
MLVYDAKCEVCGAPIRYARNAHGQRIAIDPRPSPKGRVVLLQKGGRDLAVEAGPEHGDQPRYTAHALECAGGGR